MTSLRFLRLPEPVPKAPIEWGTGKPKPKVFDMSVHRNATWRYSGEPTTQYYRITPLNLSKIRINDELVPKPQAVDVGMERIKVPVPVEHPYTSHVSYFALFPKFDSSEDPKRGVAARSQQPISSEMPAHPDNVIVYKKIKGYPVRHEFIDPIPLSERKGVYWPGEDFFDQHVKCQGKVTHQQFYPTPPKLICPNLQDRSGTDTRPDQRLSERTANALRNVERNQWMTTNQLQYSGMGPHHPMDLDNLEEKKRRLQETWVEDDSLRPYSYNTFDPTPPVNGHLPRNVCPVPIHTTSLAKGTEYENEYTGNVTPKDPRIHHLLFGADYIHVPEVPNTSEAAFTCPHKKAEKNGLDASTIPYFKPVPPDISYPEEEMPVIRAPDYPPPHEGETYLPDLKAQQDRDIQQIEAQNRWRVLEAQTPAHDLRFLRYKMYKLPPKDQPAVFYRHEGRYNEERAGLYMTSYDPHMLTASMTPDPEEPRADHLINYTLLNPNVEEQFNLTTPAYRLKENVDGALKWSRTFNLQNPELSGDRRDWPEVMETFKQVKRSQRRRLLPPSPDKACTRVQEGELIEVNKTTMGSSYNVHKFLQDNVLRPHCRDDPTTLMSAVNQNLDRVRTRTLPRPPKKSRQMDPWPGVPEAPLPPPPTLDTTHTLATRVYEQLAETKGVIDTRPPPAPALYMEDPNPPPPRQIRYNASVSSSSVPPAGRQEVASTGFRATDCMEDAGAATGRFAAQPGMTQSFSVSPQDADTNTRKMRTTTSTTTTSRRVCFNDSNNSYTNNTVLSSKGVADQTRNNNNRKGISHGINSKNSDETFVIASGDKSVSNNGDHDICINLNNDPTNTTAINGDSSFNSGRGAKSGNSGVPMKSLLRNSAERSSVQSARRSTRRVSFAEDTITSTYDNSNDNNSTASGETSASQDLFQSRMPDLQESSTESSSRTTIHNNNTEEGMDCNNNNPEDENATSTSTRFRSFPRRIPGSVHGHGLLETEYNERYKAYGFHNAILQSAPRVPSLYRFPNFDLRFKDDDPRFALPKEPQVPLPQTKLLRIKDSFCKTQIITEFREMFPDSAPCVPPCKKPLM